MKKFLTIIVLAVLLSVAVSFVVKDTQAFPSPSAVKWEVDTTFYGLIAEKLTYATWEAGSLVTIDSIRYNFETVDGDSFTYPYPILGHR